MFATYFLASALISFIGSIPIGIINMKVAYTAVTQNFRNAILTALGGCLPELVYSAAAMWFSNILMQYPEVFKWVQWLTVPIFVGMGMMMFFSKQKDITVYQQERSTSSKAPFWVGFGLGMLNPMLFTYWLMVISYMQGMGYTMQDSLAEQTFFVMGTAIGAFGLLWLVAKFSHKYFAQLGQQKLSYINKGMALIFVGLGIFQCFKIFVG